MPGRDDGPGEEGPDSEVIEPTAILKLLVPYTFASSCRRLTEGCRCSSFDDIKVKADENRWAKRSVPVWYMAALPTMNGSE